MKKRTTPQRHYDWWWSMAACRLAWIIVALPLSASAEPGASGSAYFDETVATTLFAFHDVSIPFTQGLGAEAALAIELLTHHAIPMPAFSGENAAIVRASGFQTPVVWSGKDRIAGLPVRVRFKVTFVGTKKTDIRFSAIYLR